MDTQNMVTLPPKYLKPIYMNVNSADFQTSTSTTDYTANYTTSQDYQFQASSDYQIPTTETTTTNYETTTDYSASYAQPTYTSTQETFSTSTMTGAPAGFKLMRRGSGITANEQNNIISVAMNVIKSGMEPISNNTARGVKKQLQGDWLVIVYQEGKPIDFNMTCVQGNDYLYFTIDQTAFQVCRLR